MFLGYNMCLSFLYVPIDHLRRGGGRAANGSILAALSVAAPLCRYCKKNGTVLLPFSPQGHEIHHRNVV
jgi:hypothetical protein